MEQLAGLAAPAAPVRAMTRSVPGQLDMRLTLTPGALHTVRRIVSDHLELWGAGLQEIRDSTLIAVNELLTAVLGHQAGADQDVRLLVQRIPDGLCVNVHHRTPAPMDSLAEVLLRAIADDRGVSGHGAGTDVWVSIFRPEGGAR